MKSFLVVLLIASGCHGLEYVYVCESEAVVVKPADIHWIDGIGFHIEDHEEDGTPVRGGGVHRMTRRAFEQMGKL
jgi:hypothetical protein